MSRYPDYPVGFLKKNHQNCVERNTCDGSCDHHDFEHPLQVVRVCDRSTINEHDWGFYKYCAAAIKEDKSRGLSVLLEGDEGFTP